MKMSKLKKIIYGIGISLFFSQGFLNSACSDWTDIEAKDYFVPVSDGYKNNLKDYFNSPHKVMFGWFGNWTGVTMSSSLCGLPDSVDFVPYYASSFLFSKENRELINNMNTKSTTPVAISASL